MLVKLSPGVPPNFDKSDWMSKKHEILAGFDFPNLPYLHDGEVRNLALPKMY